MTYTCPVCGYRGLERSPTSSGAALICPSCGFDFTRSDAADERAQLLWRFQWIADDKPFRAEAVRPVPQNWDPERQLTELVERQYPRDAGRAYTCPVCGYPDLTEAPRSPSGGGSYEICPSCGFQFGFTDDAQGITDEQWRQEWISLGMPWRSAGSHAPPPGWDPQRQLAAITGDD